MLPRLGEDKAEQMCSCIHQWLKTRLDSALYLFRLLIHYSRVVARSARPILGGVTNMVSVVVALCAE